MLGDEGLVQRGVPKEVRVRIGVSDGALVLVVKLHQSAWIEEAVFLVGEDINLV